VAGGTAEIIRPSILSAFLALFFISASLGFLAASAKAFTYSKAFSLSS